VIAVTGSRWVMVAVTIATLMLGLAACGSGDESSPAGGSGESSSLPPVHSDLSGLVRVDGSSIIAPLTEAVAEGFKEANPRVGVAVGTGGTGAGFEKLCAGKADVIDAAYLIDERAEELCRESGVRYEDIAVVTHALAVVVNDENPAGCLTHRQLLAIWGLNATVSNWNDVPGLEGEFDESLARFGPSAESGAYEFFSEALSGTYEPTPKGYDDLGEDGSAVIAAVADASGGTGFVAFPVYAENEDQVKAVEVDSGKGCVAPSLETIQDGSYQPFSRPQYLYLSEPSLKMPHVKAFVDYYLENVADIAESVGFVPLTERQLAKSKAEAKKAGA
jgi:phosphate transport system substrate-binding protein